jgi:tetratricopeptide (TPR) repeat protein
MTYGALLSSKLVGEGKYDQAIEAANHEIELQPDEPEAYFNRGQARVALDCFADAAQDYTKALSMDMSASSLDPETVDDELFFALRNLASQQRSNPAAAVEILNRYRQILPQGRHLDDIQKWADSFNGVETVWYRERI